MSPPRATAKYRGILAKKIAYAGAPSPRTATLLGRTDPTADAYYDAEIDKRLAALFRHYGIEPQLRTRCAVGVIDALRAEGLKRPLS